MYNEKYKKSKSSAIASSAEQSPSVSYHKARINAALCVLIKKMYGALRGIPAEGEAKKTGALEREDFEARGRLPPLCKDVLKRG